MFKTVMEILTNESDYTKLDRLMNLFEVVSRDKLEKLIDDTENENDNNIVNAVYVFLYGGGK